jgi:hypothetical protein
MHHCPSTCHEHPLQTFSGVSSGSLVAPDHEYPSHLELRLTATDSGGLTHTISRVLDPETVQLDFATEPSGLALTVGSTTQTAPFDRTVIEGSTVSLSANSPQGLAGQTYAFDSWSDGEGQTHTVVADGPATYTATFSVRSTVPEISGIDVKPRTDWVTIAWTTNEPTDAQVAYGTTSAYGTLTPSDRVLRTQHTVTIRNLARKTTYHFQILSRNASGDLGTWAGSFQTK